MKHLFVCHPPCSCFGIGRKRACKVLLICFVVRGSFDYGYSLSFTPILYTLYFTITHICLA